MQHQYGSQGQYAYHAYPQTGYPPPRRPDHGVPRALIIALGIVAFILFGSCMVCSAVLNQAGRSFEEALPGLLELRLEEEAAADEVKKACRDGEATPLQAVAADDEPWDGRCLKISGVAKHVDPSASVPEIFVEAADGSSRRLECNTWTLNTERPRHEAPVLIVGVADGLFGDPIRLDYCEWTTPAK